jgi:hypothetical protein
MPEEEEFIATLGVVRTPGGMEAMSLDSNGKAFMASVVDVDEISKFWLADIVSGGQLSSADNHLADAFVWAMEFLNGELFCWSVPYLSSCKSDSDDNLHLSSYLKEAKIARPKGLYPPTLVCKKEARDTKMHFLLGTICHIGSSSDWMQQTSSGCQTDIALGPVPESKFGCVLRAGQNSRKLHRTVAGQFDTDLFASDFLESEIYGPNDFMMTPPAFVSSLYMMFLEAAYLRTELPIMEESKLDATSKLLHDENSRLTVRGFADFAKYR